MLRAAAFKAASEGFPTLLLKPNQVEIDLEELLAFATALSEASLASEIDQVPPLLVVVDCEHESIAAIKQLPPALAASGRRLVLLQAVRHDPALTGKERRSKRVIRLKPLLALATENEALQCQTTFDSIARQWNLPFQIPSPDEWKSYEQSSRRLTPTGLDSFPSLFWVALRFFLTREIELTLQDQLEEKLGSWIERRTSQVTDSRMQAVVTYTAVFSSLRIVSPMWTVLRPVTGGSFPSTFVATVQQLRDVITWGDTSEDLGDPTLWFLHASIADEYLRRKGIRRPEQKIQVIAPVLNSLSVGHPGDVWVAETLASEIFAPRFQERRFLDWDWRLEGFEHIPPVVREQSKTILHHWARCMYLSAENTPGQLLSQGERKDRIERAIEKLTKATSLPKRPGRDEHPSHLFNTLGTAYARYAQFLEENEGSDRQISDAWNEARKAFKNSIDLLGGTNIEALLAFTDRLLSHAGPERASDAQASDTADDVAEALSLIDRAEEVLEDYANPDPDWQESLTRYRAQGMNWLRSGTGLEYLRSLQTKGDSDLGYYCEARLLLDELDDAVIEKALAILETAEQRGIPLQARTLLLRIMLYRHHSTRQWDYTSQRRSYEELETKLGHQVPPLHQFRHAVLCYQGGDFGEGSERFRKLREHLRRNALAIPRVRDTWRDAKRPTNARITQVRVTRVVSEFRGEGYADELRQNVPLRPRQFSPPARENQVLSCAIRFEINGPLAVPARFEEDVRHDAGRR